MHHNHHDHHKMRALFILKRRHDYSSDLPNHNCFTVATGMYNSAKFVSDMLDRRGIESKVVIVVDNNCIDREVTQFKPTHVFIEGYWVVPEKFDELKRLDRHKKVKWVVRCHSELPFLAGEGIALDWTFGYLRRGVAVAGNSPRIARELQQLARWAGIDMDDVDEMSPLLPNFYPVSANPRSDLLKLQKAAPEELPDGVIDVGCFGAIRPLKNHMVQAVAAVEFAKKHHRPLRFHINAGRVEMYGMNPLKNLRGLFANLGPDYELVEHNWNSHENFLKLIGQMDICMQVSFTETFNIVAADCVDVGVPIVVSDEVSWAYPFFADPNSSENIVKVMSQIWNRREAFVIYNRESLKKFSDESAETWIKYFQRR